MYLGIDIGGTKTLVATFSEEGQILESKHFPTNANYRQFLEDLSASLQSLQLAKLLHAAVGVPGLLDREAGIVFALGNLPWKNEHIRDHIAGILGGLPLIIENDGRLAGLSEAQLVKQYRTVLFLSLGTGIGGALLQGGQIVTALQDTEMGKMPLLHEDSLVNWEDFAAGRGIVKRFGKKASEITDNEQWKEVGLGLAEGIAPLCAVLQPEVIILGGGVGTYADNYNGYIAQFLKTHLHPVIKQPRAILAARRPKEAVVYGCYELAKATYGTHP